MNTTNLTPTEAVSTEAKTETAITSAAPIASASAVSAASITSTLTPTPGAASAGGPAVVPARFSAPVRATSGERWPGQREWNDHDYRQFVDLVSQGAFPEIENDSCVWDEFFVRDRESDTPFRPMLISQDDYRGHLTYYREYYGLLAWKLWDVARSKGFTAGYDEEMQREEEELERREEEVRRRVMRGEVDELKQNMPVPQPVKSMDPRRRWHEQVMATLPAQAPLVDQVKHVQAQVMAGQPFRSAVLMGTEAEAGVADEADGTFGPLMLPESADALGDPFDPEVAEAEPVEVRQKWAPGATQREILHGAARDLADLVSLHVARQKVSAGFQPDDKSVEQIVRLVRSLEKLEKMESRRAERRPGPRRKMRLQGGGG